MAAANTGTANNNKYEVIKIDQTNSGKSPQPIPSVLIFVIVQIKFIAPIKDDAPATCKLKIAKSTAAPGCPITPAKGGYNVHPVPTPTSTNVEVTSKYKDTGNNQKLKLFNLGNAISGAPIINGTNQFPKPPINIGITIKKIITKACPVTTVL